MEFKYECPYLVLFHVPNYLAIWVPPLSLRGLDFMHYENSGDFALMHLRTAGTLTFVKTMAVFSTVCHVLLYPDIFAFVYQMPHIFLALRGQCKKLKHGTFAWLYPRHVRGLGAWLKPTGIVYFLGESSLAPES